MTGERDALRARLAQRLKVEVWTVKIAGLSDAEATHLADAVMPFLRERYDAGYRAGSSDAFAIVAEQIKIAADTHDDYYVSTYSNGEIHALVDDVMARLGGAT